MHLKVICCLSEIQMKLNILSLYLINLTAPSGRTFLHGKDIHIPTSELEFDF